MICGSQVLSPNRVSRLQMVTIQMPMVAGPMPSANSVRTGERRPAGAGTAAAGAGSPKAAAIRSAPAGGAPRRRELARQRDRRGQQAADAEAGEEAERGEHAEGGRQPAAEHREGEQRDRDGEEPA